MNCVQLAGPFVVIVDEKTNILTGIPGAEKIVIDAAAKAGILCLKQCVQYVSYTDLAQLAWWYENGIRVFIGVYNLASAAVEEFFNTRPAAMYICTQLADVLGLYTVFSYANVLTNDELDFIFNDVVGTNTGVADFAANGVLLSWGPDSDFLYGTQIVPQFTYPLLTTADLTDLIDNHAADINNACCIVVGGNPPDLLMDFFDAFPNNNIVGLYRNKNVIDEAVAKGCTFNLVEEVVGHLYDKLMVDTFGTPIVNSFYENLIYAAQTALQISCLWSSRCCNEGLISNTGPMLAQFGPEDEREVIRDVEVVVTKFVGVLVNRRSRVRRR